MMDPTTEVSRLLRHHLQPRRWTASDLADFMGLSPATVWRWCVGETIPGDAHRPAICRILSIPPETLAAACAADAVARNRKE